jgi:hypothetical protein
MAGNRVPRLSARRPRHRHAGVARHHRHMPHCRGRARVMSDAHRRQAEKRKGRGVIPAFVVYEPPTPDAGPPLPPAGARSEEERNRVRL